MRNRLSRKWKRMTGKLMAPVLAAAIVLSGTVPSFAATTRGRNTTTVKSGCKVVNVSGTFESADTTALVNRINAIRYEACSAGNVPDPRNPRRYLTKSDYRAIKWSTELEKMAQLRAAEATVVYTHTRPNGDSNWTASYGIMAYAENLSGKTMAASIESYYTEKAQYLKVKSFRSDTGHYINMINPNHTYIALSAFTDSKGERSSALEATTTTAKNVSEKKTGAYGSYIQQVEMTNSLASKYTASASTQPSTSVTPTQPSTSVTPTQPSTSTTPTQPSTKPKTQNTVAVVGVFLTDTSLQMQAGESKTMEVLFLPSYATNKTLTWTSSNTAVASVSNGKVTAKKAGTAKITVKSNNGKTSVCTVTVKAKPAASAKLQLSYTKLNMTPGQSVKMMASNAKGLLSYESSNSTSARAITSSDEIVAFQPGKAIITVKDSTGATGTCEVTVAYKAGENVRLTAPKTVLRLKVGQKYAWKATLTPRTTTDKIMYYGWSGNGVITYDNGYIVAKKAGTDTITVRTMGGKVVSCKVTVTK